MPFQFFCLCGHCGRLREKCDVVRKCLSAFEKIATSSVSIRTPSRKVRRRSKTFGHLGEKCDDVRKGLDALANNATAPGILSKVSMSGFHSVVKPST